MYIYIYLYIYIFIYIYIYSKPRISGVHSPGSHGHGGENQEVPGTAVLVTGGVAKTANIPWSLKMVNNSGYLYVSNIIVG